MILNYVIKYITEGFYMQFYFGHSDLILRPVKSQRNSLKQNMHYSGQNAMLAWVLRGFTYKKVFSQLKCETKGAIFLVQKLILQSGMINMIYRDLHVKSYK